MEFDYDRLRKDLIDYFGTASYIVSSLVLMNLCEIERASNEDLLNIALQNGFDLKKYKINKVLGLYNI